MTQHSVHEELRGIVAFVGVVWCVFFAGLILPFSINAFGVTPRSLIGLVGVPLMPFLHANFQHLVSNTLPLTILLLLLAGSQANSGATVVSIIILGGGLLWLFGRPATHVGASGLIYGLITFLLVSGFAEKRFVPLVTSIIVGVLYGGTLISGIIPTLGSNISWDGHLFGAVAGSLVAGVSARRIAETKRSEFRPPRIPT